MPWIVYKCLWTDHIVILSSFKEVLFVESLIFTGYSMTFQIEHWSNDFGILCSLKFESLIFINNVFNKPGDCKAHTELVNIPILTNSIVHFCCTASSRFKEYWNCTCDPTMQISESADNITRKLKKKLKKHDAPHPHPHPHPTKTKSSFVLEVVFPIPFHKKVSNFFLNIKWQCFIPSIMFLKQMELFLNTQQQ